jgi:DNA-binding transcriptional MerR regulator
VSGPRVFTLPEIAKLAGAEYRTLKSWVEKGFASPSVRATDGAGHTELYSARDAQVLCKLAELRRRGLDIDHLEAVAKVFATTAIAECSVCGGTLNLNHLTPRADSERREPE